MSAELAPCPFCGGKAYLLTGLVEFVDAEISCMACAATGGNENDGATEAENQAAAIAAWNRRTPIKPSGDTGELRERVARIIDPISWEAVDVYGWTKAAFIGLANEGSLTKADTILDLIQSERAG